VKEKFTFKKEKFKTFFFRRKYETNYYDLTLILKIREDITTPWRS
jgi:hypothetical protein